MKKINKKKETNCDRDFFDYQEYLVKYITNFFGFKDVRVEIGNDILGFVDGELLDCKIIQVSSVNPEVFRILLSIFNPLYDSIQKTEDGTLTMSWNIGYHTEQHDGNLISEYDWENELNRILLDFISMTLKPIGKI
jgi:hypothetical protein